MALARVVEALRATVVAVARGPGMAAGRVAKGASAVTRAEAVAVVVAADSALAT